MLGAARWAQAMAIGQQRVYALTFSEDRHFYGLTRAVVNEEADTQDNSFEPVPGHLGRRHAVPDAVHVDTQADRIGFYPDGTIDPAVIELDSATQKAKLSSNYVRGMLTQVDNE